MHTSAYFRPTSLPEAWRLKQEHPQAQFVAGGTDIMVCLREEVGPAPALISVRSVAELKGIEVGPVTRLGAATTVAEILAHEALCQRFPALFQAARRIGSPQIRSVGTVGGNLCNASPCADTAPPLLVYGATVRLASLGPDGSPHTRDLALDEFFDTPGQTRIDSGELLQEVLLEDPGPRARSIFLKKARTRMDLSQVSVAALLETEGAKIIRVRLAAGSVGPRPLRLHKTEELLSGHEASPELLKRARTLAREEIAPISDVRASAGYRRHMTGVLVGRALRALLDGAS